MDTSNGLPERISPDSLKDTIVQVHFTTEYNYSKLETTLKEVLEELNPEGFHPYPIGKNENKIREDITYIGENRRYFYSDGITKVLIDGSTISFNCVNGYPGWNNYRNLILGVLDRWKEFVSYKSLMIRYISIFANESIQTFLDGKIYLKELDIFNGSTFSFNCKASGQGYNADVVVRLTEKAKTSTGLASVSDVMVSTILDDNISFQEVRHNLDYIHFAEKDVFFKLLKREYVESLNPVWPNEGD